MFRARAGPGRLLLNRAPTGLGHVVALAFDQLVAWGVLSYATGLLLFPVAAAVGVCREEAARAQSLAFVVTAIAAPAIGRWLDRVGARAVLRAGAVAGLLSLVVMALSAGSLTLLVALLLNGFAQALALYDAAFHAVVAWFPQPSKRTRAIVVLTSIGGMASAVFLPLAAMLLGRWGAQAALVILLLVFGSIALPVRMLLPGAGPANTRTSTHAPDRRDGARAFTWLAGALSLHGFTSAGVALFLVWHLAEQGQSLEAAAALAGLAGAAQVPGRLLVARFQGLLAKAGLSRLLVVQAAALLGIAMGRGWLSLVAIIVFGAASGLVTLARAAVTVEWFGHEAFGERNGVLTTAVALARACAPYIVALVGTALGHARALALLAAVLLLGALAARAAERARAARLVSREQGSRGTPPEQSPRAAAHS